jgi:O-antigen/teichoic acid export membrane protein
VAIAFHQDIRARTLRGFLLVAGQRACSLLITAAGGILLARHLTPETFGVYAVIGFAVALTSTCGDLGLGAALVQRPAGATGIPLQVAFTAQIAVATLLAAALAGVAPVITHGLGLPANAIGPLRALCLLVPLAAVRMPSAVMLERELTYLPLMASETIETVTYFGVAVAVAVRGGGVWSFVVGAVAGRCLGLCALLCTAPWRPALRWRWSDLAPLLRFGASFQGSALVIAIRDSVVPTLIVSWSGVAAAGFLNWAASVAFLPLQVITVAGRVLFPALSTLQRNPEAFARALERALNRVAVILYPAALLLLVSADRLIPALYGSVWLPSVPAVRLFCLTAVVGGTVNLLIQGLYGLGQAKTVLYLNLLWATAVWALAAALVALFGFVGFAAASFIASIIMAGAACAALRPLQLKLRSAIRVPLTAATLSAGCFFLGAQWWADTSANLGLGLAGAGAAYLALLWHLGGPVWRGEVIEDCRRAWPGNR